MPPPLVGVSACVKSAVGESLAFHAAADAYVDAVLRGAGAVPVILPALGGETMAAALHGLHGLLLTGSRSNVDPALYGGPPGTAPPHDPRRDATVPALVLAALAAGLPVLAVCRGMQELNVALGGSLHAAVHDAPGLSDHRSPSDRPLDRRFAPAHEVAFTPGGLLATITGRAGAWVNSLHGQGIDRLAPALAVEAVAPDGLVEAVRVADSRAFALGVQWHPEWRVTEDAVSLAIFRAFGAASNAYRA